ncbi:MAG: protein kinase domain-containing protein, partial [Gammaproteobacteria bacterium]
MVTIYEYGVDRGTPFIAMEFIDGRGLNEYLEEGVRFKLDRVVAIMRQVLEALDYCHRHGVIHRDLKPANIVILADGGVKITDRASVNRCVNSSGGFPHRLLFDSYSIGIGRSLVDVFEEVCRIE